MWPAPDVEGESSSGLKKNELKGSLLMNPIAVQSGPFGYELRAKRAAW